jgi:hypothetical protein
MTYMDNDLQKELEKRLIVVNTNCTVCGIFVKCTSIPQKMEEFKCTMCYIRQLGFEVKIISRNGNFCRYNLVGRN